LRPAWANTSGDPNSKITGAKWTGGMAQAVEYLLCYRVQTPVPLQKKKKKRLSASHTCNFSDLGGSYQKEIAVRGQTQQKVSKTSPQPASQA
jgi:hypothetical protein